MLAATTTASPPGGGGVESRIERSRIHRALAQNARLKIGSQKYKSRISRKWLIAAVGANPEELSLNHTHGRSSAQQHAAQTAGVKTNFMS